MSFGPYLLCSDFWIVRSIVHWTVPPLFFADHPDFPSSSILIFLTVNLRFHLPGYASLWKSSLWKVLLRKSLLMKSSFLKTLFSKTFPLEILSPRPPLRLICSSVVSNPLLDVHLWSACFRNLHPIGSFLREPILWNPSVLCLLFWWVNNNS